MKRKRKFYFKKHIIVTNFKQGDTILDSTYEYKTVNNLSIATQIVNLLHKNKIGYEGLVDWQFNDFDFCWVEIKSEKQDYFKFAIDFMDAFEGYMDDYKLHKNKN